MSDITKNVSCFYAIFIGIVTVYFRHAIKAGCFLSSNYFGVAMFRKTHIEKHFTASDTIRDIIVGMSDGLTVPFALAAGLSGAVDSTTIIITAGLAEIAAGSIAMGLGGYLAAKSDAEHYAREEIREYSEIEKMASAERIEVKNIFEKYGLSFEQSNSIISDLSKRPKDYVDFMMRFELDLEKPNPKRALKSAITIALSYVCGGIVPLIPYMIMSSAKQALPVSAIFTLIALFIFGYIKGYFTTVRPMRGAIQTMLIGGLAATVAFIIARLAG